MIILNKKLIFFISIIVLILIIMATGVSVNSLNSPTSKTYYINFVKAQKNEIIYGSKSSRVDKPTGTGPHSTTYMFDYIPRVNDTYVPARIYYPTSGGGAVDPTGAPYHGVVFAPGAGGTETSYSSTLSTIASWGFIVTIVGTGGPCNQEVVDIQSHVLDYYEDLNSNSSSIFYNKINSSVCGASGHSNGGWTAIAGAVADDRFQAVCTLAAAAGPYYDSGQANTNYLNVPLQLVAGADDHTYLPSSDAYYQLAKPIKSYIKIIGSGHGGPFNLEYLVSFFKFWLNGNKEYAIFIYGDEIQKDINDGEVTFQSDVGLNPYPEISNTNVYEDELINFTADGFVVTPNPPDRTLIRFEWDFDQDGNYDWESEVKRSTYYFFEDNGEYVVRFKITDSWGMIATNDYSISVKNKKPVGDAGIDLESVEDELLFFDAGNSTDTSSDFASLLYQWDFGDNNWTTWDYSPTATHAFSEEDEYTVRVYIKDDDNAIGGDSITVTVTNVAPKADFSMDKTMANVSELINFNATKTWDTPSDVSSLNYLWDFGDTDLAEGIFVKHSYDDEGVYTVKLTVGDNNEATSTATKIITILNSPPSCHAMDDIEIYEDEYAELSGTGSDTKSDEKNLQFSWDLGIIGFNNTQWNSTADFEYKYAKAGVYYATLFVKDDDGDLGNDTVKITVLNLKPTAKFDVSSSKVFEDELINFDAGDSTDTESDLKILNYSWSFDDDSLNGFGKTISHSYNSSGEYTVWLTVMDDNGAYDTFSRKIMVSNVNPSAKINASDSNVLPGEKVIFSAVQIQDTPSDLDGLIFTWDFGDNTKGIGKLVSHRYSKTGRYTVKLTIKDVDGATTSYETSITVIEAEPEDVGDDTDTGEENINITIIIIPIILVIIVILILVFIFMIRKKSSGKDDVNTDSSTAVGVLLYTGEQEPTQQPQQTQQLQQQQQTPTGTNDQSPQDQYSGQQYNYISMPPKSAELQAEQYAQLPPAIPTENGITAIEDQGQESISKSSITQDNTANQDSQVLDEHNKNTSANETGTLKDRSMQILKTNKNQSESIIQYNQNEDK